jgi:hypothetical protein
MTNTPDSDDDLHRHRWERPMSSCPCGAEDCAARDYDPTRGPRLDGNYRALVAHLNKLTATENSERQQRWQAQYGIGPAESRDAGHAR